VVSTELTIKIIEIWGKFGVFQVFFLTLRANPCFWVKNGGCYVSLRGLGDIGKKNASKNVGKLGKIGINFNKFGKIQLFWQKFIKIHTFFKLTFC
jgi:hypothetical protein